jgi:hypothetical protein
MKQQAVVQPAEKACVICGKLCYPYGRTLWGGNLCSRKCNTAFYKLPYEEQTKRGVK